MVKCLYCNSSAVRKYDWDISFESDEDIIIYREYVCKDCGEYFRTKTFYTADGEEIVCEEDE